ncbi:MAG: hypothetical protein R3362_11705, partial [Rhodothermales bacterium]|nr:hypothetical protein [Rhodothermales bacterium]
GFETAPTTFTFLQVAAPIFLLILTRLRMPVSTTFLLLSCFSTSPGGVAGVLEKSLWGYVVAFFAAIAVWFAVTKAVPQGFTGTAARWWMPAQWVSTGFLWSTWIMQDAANIAVYLPRSLSLVQFLAFTGAVFGGLGVLFYLRGDRIQEVVTEKTDTLDVRSATLIDFVYAIILFVFKEVSQVPMSTTWVFIGLLGGRELAFNLAKRQAEGPRSYRATFRLMGRDLLYAGIGLAVSIALALATNPALR